MSVITLPTPTDRLLVYDLVKEAGLDVSEWSNYKRSNQPASNPKYCYEWAFEQNDKIALCLWYKDMIFEDDQVYQEHNYRDFSASRMWANPQRKRAQKMDLAIQHAYRNGLPIRVIIVDGSKREENAKSASKVERRLLDPESWYVSHYDDDGNCHIDRGSLDSAPLKKHKLTRIAYNSSNWQRPTGDASKLEASGTYNSEVKYGHDDWLFRAEWQIDGWRYAFLQGFNKRSGNYLSREIDVTLYTVEPDKKKRLVATIYEVEALDDDQALRAVEVFKAKGWYSSMKKEIAAVGGDPKSLDSAEKAAHILNIRFRTENVDTYNAYLPETKWLYDRHRYMLYDFNPEDRKKLERSMPRRRGTQVSPKTRKLFRKGTKSTTYTPEHQMIQSKLQDELIAKFGKENVWLEEDFVDVKVETKNQLIYFEIKTDISPRSVIRQALGQILEYAYYPNRTAKQPTQLVIVGRTQLDAADESYLDQLCQKFKLPLSYRVVELQ